MQPSSSSWTEVWPALPYGAWKDTCTTLHLWTQIVGKVRLAQTPRSSRTAVTQARCAIGHVTPEALDGGPIALVEET